MRVEQQGAVGGGAASSTATTVAEHYLAVLKDRGVDFLYVGAGTDTAPIVEAYARAQASGLQFPTPVLAVHENLAVGMAHGYYMVSGKPQAVMLHVSVGTANAVCALMNAARARAPMFFTSGRTPLFESGYPGSRTSEIHWAQEMYDQAGMVREFVKWEYELRDGINVEQVVDRALNIAMAEPKGPVYLTLPREVLARAPAIGGFGRFPATPTAAFPDATAVRRLAHALAAAEFPVIVPGLSGSDPGTVPLLASLCERFAIGIAEAKVTRQMNAPSTHRLHLGHELGRVFPKADALLFLENDVPWVHRQTQPTKTAFIAHAGVDPLFVNYPVRSFPADLSITTSVRALLDLLAVELEAMGVDRDSRVAARRQRLAQEARQWDEHVQSTIASDAAQGGPITKLFLSHCLEQVRPSDAVVVNEYSLVREALSFDEPGTFFSLPSSGGLGWGIAAALGAKQAAPDKMVIAVVGDGAYIFNNPAACHQAAAMHGLPVLIVVYNNEAWDAVQLAATGMYPNQSAARERQERGTAPIASLKPLPDFERYAEASGGYGERVTSREQLLPALRRALDVVQREKRVALLNVMGV
ncbi:MAG: thiamine pyrophosphate-requiring protein [Ramlibacter sp.]|uniref:thiamine pyrophosphate-requiring protein n=1 Tax=Ramlibacter sp. TaxID=1917967 RepID=UPI00261AE043|nr:thiamine pyrophosphate-requiring protein [Ramlibacter sp.]MDB5750022.1 thiamine pyrophosphate-requiring protein [Ramlibacter sp.]